MKTKFLHLDLQLFAEGAAASGTGASAVGSTGAMSGSGENTQAAVATEGAEPSQEDRAELYKKFREDYRQEIDSEFQTTLRKRLKSANDFKGKVNPIMEILAEKYNCKSDDIDAISKAIMDDNSFYEEDALAEGMSVEAMKELKTLRRQNNAYKEAEANASRLAEERQAMQMLEEEAANVRKVYKGFDLKTELKNPEFASLLKNHVSMQRAYEVIHHDEIIPAVMQLASQKTATKIANSVAANKARPIENGMSSVAAAISTLNVDTMTKEQMADIKARVARGEKVTL